MKENEVKEGEEEEMKKQEGKDNDKIKEQRKITRKRRR
jgi:hypothetical protein